MKLAHIFEGRISVLLYVKDYLQKGGDRFYLYDAVVLRECAAQEILDFQGLIITHDYGMIARAIFKATGALPSRLIDVVEMHRATVGERAPLKSTHDAAFRLMSDGGLSLEDVKTYAAIFFGRSAFCERTFAQVGGVLLEVCEALLLRAHCLGELPRYIDVEMPVFALLWRSAVNGIRIDVDRLREFKNSIEDDFYRELKLFSIKHRLAFEVPGDDALWDRLEAMGMDVENSSVNYILSYLHFPDDFGTDVLALRKLARARSVLGEMSVRATRAFPHPVVAGTVTSRVLLQGPALQNLGRPFRSVICADEGKVLEYVDYSQFEVGVMVGLSSDPFMRSLYETGDLYAEVAERLFDDRSRRGIAKKLFLSYSYGMTVKRVVDAAVEQGATRQVASALFRSFEVFEEWKRSTQISYHREGAISTMFGGGLVRRSHGALSPKESRSCISQVVQGTASLIFKRALIALDSLEGIDVLLPMHDAVLFQSSLQHSGVEVKRIFEDVFDKTFEGSVKGRADISKF